MADRKPLSKRLRFSIFARDGFSCRYCGRQSDVVTLVVDHVIPVAAGGTNDEANLITSCEECNQGKAARQLDQAAPTETDRLRMMQEAHEQRLAAEHASAFSEAKKDREQEIVNLWCQIRGTKKADVRTVRVMARFVDEHGLKCVSDWIERAHDWKPWSEDYAIGMIVSGYRRAEKERAAQPTQQEQSAQQIRQLEERLQRWIAYARRLEQDTIDRLESILAYAYVENFHARDLRCGDADCDPKVAPCRACRTNTLWFRVAIEIELGRLDEHESPDFSGGSQMSEANEPTKMNGEERHDAGSEQ